MTSEERLINIRKYGQKVIKEQYKRLGVLIESGSNRDIHEHLSEMQAHFVADELIEAILNDEIPEITDKDLEEMEDNNVSDNGD